MHMCVPVAPVCLFLSANQLMGLAPGEVFEHRNIANCINHTDLNALSVLQYAVEYLKVQDIIVCGHYVCGGVRAALSTQEFGLIDNWLRVIKDTYVANQEQIDKLPTEEERHDKMVELNVVRSVSRWTEVSAFLFLIASPFPGSERCQHCDRAICVEEGAKSCGSWPGLRRS